MGERTAKRVTMQRSRMYTIISISIAAVVLTAIFAITSYISNKEESVDVSVNKGVYIAYNPSEHLTEVNGKVFAGLSADPRDYVNLKGRTFTAFKPCVGDEIVVTADAITGSPTVGEFVEAGTDGKGVPSATASAGKTSFKVTYKKNIPFPAGGIGNEQVTAYALVCVQE